VQGIPWKSQLWDMLELFVGISPRFFPYSRPDALSLHGLGAIRPLGRDQRPEASISAARI
jgi:hypothetical protein